MGRQSCRQLQYALDLVDKSLLEVSSHKSESFHPYRDIVDESSLKVGGHLLTFALDPTLARATSLPVTVSFQNYMRDRC